LGVAFTKQNIPDGKYKEIIELIKTLTFVVKRNVDFIHLTVFFISPTITKHALVID